MSLPSPCSSAFKRTLFCALLVASCATSRSQEVGQERDPAAVSARFEGYTLDDLRALAGDGDPLAQYHLGKTLTRRGEFDEGFKWTQEAAMQGLALGQYNHHVNYFHGHGVQRDIKQAIHWLTLAADGGHALGEFTLAEHYRKGDAVGRDLRLAAKYYRMAAELGHAQAQYRFARMLESGDGVERNNAESIRWLTRSADGGYDRAQLRLGYNYSTGRGVEKNDPKAVHYYSLAAEQGNRTAQYNVGRRCAYGTGTTKDLPKGIHWLRRSADQGYENAMYLLGWLAEHERDSLGLTIAPNYKIAQEWYEKAARAGHAQGMMRLGLILTSGGLGDEKRMSGVEWLKRSAEAGEAEAAYELGSILLSNRSWIRMDLFEAARWFRKGAERDDAGSQFELGKLYLFGEDFPSDKQAARRWLRKARDNGNTDAALLLGATEGSDLAEMFAHHSRDELLDRAGSHAQPTVTPLAEAYENGIGGPEDFKIAAYLYARDVHLRSADQGGDMDGLARLFALHEVRHDKTDSRNAPDPRELDSLIRKCDADVSDPTTMFLLGRLYIEGLGVEEDRAQGVRWLLRAAQAGHLEAITRIGRMWMEGEGGVTDRAEAERWFRNAAVRGSVEARYELGSLLLDLPERRTEGAAWLRLAASASHSAAAQKAIRLDAGLDSDEQAEVSRWVRRISETEPGRTDDLTRHPPHSPHSKPPSSNP